MTNGDITLLHGNEDVVLFLPGQRFSGVDEDWLLPRLRLNPAASPYDHSPNEVAGPLGIELNGEWLDVDDFWGTLGLFDEERTICSANDGWVIGASAELLDEWLLDLWPEVREVATWVGPHPDLHALALEWGCAYVVEWASMGSDSTIELTSELLAASRLADRSRLIAAAESTGRRPVLNGIPLDSFMESVLRGDEEAVWFTSGQEFGGVTEEWLRPRLRLDPAQGEFDLEGAGPNVILDGEYIEDLDLEVILGTGSNDGTLISIVGPGDCNATAYVRGGWLETVAPDLSHDVSWMGVDPDFQAVVEAWILGWTATWGEVEVTFDRVGACSDASETDT